MDEERSAIKSLRRIVLETTLKRISLPGIAQPSSDVVGVQNKIPDDELPHIGRRGSTRRGRRWRPRYIAACSRKSADECERCGAQQTPPDTALRHSSRAPPNALQRAAGAFARARLFPCTDKSVFEPINHRDLLDSTSTRHEYN